MPDRRDGLAAGDGSTWSAAVWNANQPAGPISRWWVLGWLVPMFVQLAHTMVVAPTYFVGSFDDDANYLMAAHVLAAGGGLTSTMPSGASVVANYLPGYPVLLVPLIWVFGSALWPARLLSTLCVAALYPLLWTWMGRRGVKPSYRVAVLGLLAINTVMATYSTMVMAEAPFLLVFVLALFALDRWENHPGVQQASLVVLLLAGLVWLKEAGIGLVVGLVAYELWRRRWPRAVGLSVGVGALLLPGLVARWLTGGATLGDRYTGEISNGGDGGFWHQVPTEAVNDTWSYVKNVLRQSVLPAGSPLPTHGSVFVLMTLIGVTVPVFSVVGAVVWYRRHPTGESWMVWAYFVETLAYPFNNQRRVILVLPVVTIWYVVGAAAAGRLVVALGAHTLGRVAASVAVVVAVLAAGIPTAAGFTRDYLYKVGQKSSEFARSPAMTLLKSIGPPSALVETDYRGSVAFFSDHRTGWTAFTLTTRYGPFAIQHPNACSVAVVKNALRADDAEFLMVGDLNFPTFMDSPCLLHLASYASTAKGIGAVRLLSTDHDHTSVFELVGHNSPRPDLEDWTADVQPSSGAHPTGLTRNGQGDAGGTGYRVAAGGHTATFDWSWPKPVGVTQLSVGSITSTAPVRAASISIELPDGVWRTLSRVAGPVGDEGVAPYLLEELPSGTTARAVEVLVDTSGTAQVTYVNAIGPAPVAARGRSGLASG